MNAEPTRAEHMAWCKKRALVYVEKGELGNALASFGSDVQKHPDTDTIAITTMIATMGMKAAMDGDVAAMRRFIEGFAE